MTRLKITCLGCGQTWLIAKEFTIYEKQAIEGCACPRCEARTLCCSEPKERRPVEYAKAVRDWRPTPVRS